MGRNSASRSVDPVHQFCEFIVLSGFDFSRNLPRLGLRALWKLLHYMQHIDLLQASQTLAALCISYTNLFLMKNTVPEGMCNRQECNEASLDTFGDVSHREHCARHAVPCRSGRAATLVGGISTQRVLELGL